jgi:ribosomal protein S18
MRKVSKKDIDYKNLPMMTRFLNDIGKLQNRYQTRLESPVHRKVSHTVKKMRAQFLLPTVGVIKPTDRIALGSYIEDIEEMHKKSIDPVTGRLFLKYSLQDDLKQKLAREKNRFEERFGHIEKDSDFARVQEKA